MKFIKDEDTRVMALRSGEVDMISDFVHGGSDYTPRNQLKPLAEEGFKVFKRIEPLTWIVAFNYKKEPFNDNDMRKAVNLAVDRDEVAEVFANEVKPAKTLFMENAPGVKEAKEMGLIYEYKPDEAKEIVDRKGFDGTVSFIVDKNQSDQVLVGQLIQQQLKKVGINVNLEVLESGAFKQRRDSGEYDLRFYYIGGTDRRFYMRMYWRFYPGQKWSAYVSERSGELCKAILREFDPEKRKQYLIEFYKVIYEENGVAPLYFDVMTTVGSRNLDATWDEVFKWPNGYEVGEPLFYAIGVKK